MYFGWIKHILSWLLISYISYVNELDSYIFNSLTASKAAKGFKWKCLIWKFSL